MNNFNYKPDPEVTKVRDQIIKKIGNKPLDEVNAIIKKLLNGQMDEITRLGALAARVKIIRLRIEELYETNAPKKFKKVEIRKNTEELKVSEKKKEDWFKVKMLEPAEVNGKQIDKGVVLDVSKIDAQTLIQSKKAISLNDENDKEQNKKELKKNNNLDPEVKNEKKVEKNEKEQSELDDQVKIKEANSTDKKKDLDTDSDNEDKIEYNKKLENNNLEKKEIDREIEIKSDNESVSNEEKISKDDLKYQNKNSNDIKIKVKDKETKKEDLGVKEAEVNNDENLNDNNKNSNLNNNTENSNDTNEQDKEIKKDDEKDLLKIHEEKAKNEEK